MTMNLESFFDVTNPVVDPLWADVAKFVRAKAATNPRSLQKALGPSQVGHPCMRRMAYGMMEIPRCNPEWDPLPSILGTAAHAWMEEAARADNERLGRERWLIETRVNVAPGLSGSSDLYDTDSGTVIDHKFLGYTSFAAHVKDPGEQYKNQLRLYGKGFQNAGYDVKRVCIAMFPRTGTLTKMHMWFEDYDEAKADAVLARRESVMIMLDSFDVDIDPARYQWIPIDNTAGCVFCEWWSPNPQNPLQCGAKS